MSTSIETDRHHTAIHEAGHAVIGRKLGLSCGQASVIAEDDSAGHSIAHDPAATMRAWEDQGRFRAMETVMRGRIMAFMAGGESEELILGACSGGDGDDRYQVDLMLETITSNDRLIAIEARLRSMTRMLVRRHEALIRTVATSLELRGTLAPEDIDAVVPSPSRIGCVPPWWVSEAGG